VPLTLPIREVLVATPRARIVRLEIGDHPFEYAAGQAVLVGNHGQPKRRPYSIAGAPEDTRRDRWIELLVGVDENGASKDHLTLSAGAALDVDGPLGTFTFPEDPEERRFLFIAGGTGIAPLRAMLRHALAIPHRDVGLLYSARTPDEFAYEEELRALAHEGRIEFRQTVTRADDDATWTGTRGRIGRADLEPLVHAPATLCCICGPPPLVAGMLNLLRELGVERRRIRIEEWG